VKSQSVNAYLHGRSQTEETMQNLKVEMHTNMVEVKQTYKDDMTICIII